MAEEEMRFVYVCNTCSIKQQEVVYLGCLRARLHVLVLHRVFRVNEGLAALIRLPGY